MEFSVLKTKISVSPLFFAVLTAFLLIDRSGIANQVILFSALHEAFHFLALLCIKTAPKKIELSVFGIRLFLNNNMSTIKKCVVLMAGFTVNFVLALLFFIYGKNMPALINLFIGILTSLPLESADGGSILSALFEEFSSKKVEKIFGIIKSFFIFVFSIFLVFIIFTAKNYFLIIPLIYIFITAKKNAAP